MVSSLSLVEVLGGASMGLRLRLDDMVDVDEEEEDGYVALNQLENTRNQDAFCCEGRSASSHTKMVCKACRSDIF